MRFPCIEAVLGTQTPLHDCTVVIRDTAGRRYTFLISCQVGEGLPLNPSLAEFVPGCLWSGSLVVMRCGVNVSHIGLRGRREKDLAFKAVQR